MIAPKCDQNNKIIIEKKKGTNPRTNPRLKTSHARVLVPNLKEEEKEISVY